MKMYTTIGRIIFAIPFIVFGVFHLINADQMSGMVPFPPKVLWVYVSGIGLILAGISLLIQKQVKLAMRLLSVELLLFVLLVHLPNLLHGDQMAMGSLLKDLGLMGAALFIVGHTDE